MEANVTQERLHAHALLDILRTPRPSTRREAIRFIRRCAAAGGASTTEWTGAFIGSSRARRRTGLPHRFAEVPRKAAALCGASARQGAPRSAAKPLGRIAKLIVDCVQFSWSKSGARLSTSAQTARGKVTINFAAHAQS